MRRNLQTIFLAAALGTAAFAQSSSTLPDPATMATQRVSRLAVQLSLTDAQKASAITIFTNAITAAEALHTSLQANHTAMQTAIQKNDTATIDTLATQAGTLDGQLTAINAKANAAFYALLTSAQQTAFNSMPHGFGGPGGPGGPGGRGH
jgi:hypothetical protein